MPSRREAGRRALPLRQYGKDVLCFYLLGVGGSYLLAFFFHSRLPGSGGPEAAEQTFRIFLILSLCLSGALPFVRSTFGASLLLLFRLYLIAVQGYGTGGFFTLKLVLGLALLMETGLLLERPYRWIFSGLFIPALVFSQLYNPFFGHSALPAREVFASADVLSVLFFLFALFSGGLLLMADQAARRSAMARDLAAERETMRALAEFNADLQGYARRVDEESSLRERQRLSREIHDISGYIFTNLIALLGAAGSVPEEDREGLSDILTAASKQAREGLKETRVALRKTRDRPVPEEEGLRAINKIIGIFRKITGVRVRVDWGNAPHSFSREVNFILYRTVQEALTNAVRHGRATEITLQLLVREGRLRLTVQDNGLGSQEIVQGIGLTGMEERVGGRGGRLGVRSGPGGGFTLEVELPLEPEAPETGRFSPPEAGFSGRMG